MTEGNGKRATWSAGWFFAFGVFFISGALFLEHVLEQVIVATGGVMLVSMGMVAHRDGEVHKWMTHLAFAVTTAVSLLIWLI